MTPVGLHSGLSAPLQHCEAVRRELRALLASLPAGRWDARPDAGGWAVAEHVDHLIRSEVGTSKMARRLIRGDFTALARPADARLHDSRLEEYPYGRLAAPAELEPTPRPVDDALRDLEAAHLRFVQELHAFRGPDADALSAPDPASGVWFTLAGWVRLQALHEAHHILLIREAARLRGE